jgi:hypothetical protein
MGDTLISVHFPKASGSSIRLALQKVYGDKLMVQYSFDPVDPGNPEYIDPIGYAKSRPSSLLSCKAVHGHFSPRHFDRIENAKRIVMLREPVDNLISIYFYWQSIFADGFAGGHSLYHYATQNKLSVLETAQLPLMRCLMSRSYFGDFDMGRFDVIGTYDRREHYFQQVMDLTGLEIESSGHHNKTPPSEARGNVLADTRLMAQLRDTLIEDIRFFEKYAA